MGNYINNTVQNEQINIFETSKYFYLNSTKKKINNKIVIFNDNFKQSDLNGLKNYYHEYNTIELKNIKYCKLCDKTLNIMSFDNFDKSDIYLLVLSKDTKYKLYLCESNECIDIIKNTFKSDTVLLNIKLNECDIVNDTVKMNIENFNKLK